MHICTTSLSISYWAVHCDKANNFEYEVGCLLYLNSSFKGGDFVFVDDDGDRVIEPIENRLLVFTSSVENIHRVEKVTEGDRMLLSVWYSLVPDDDESSKELKI